MKVKSNVISWIACAAAVLAIGHPATAGVVDISSGPNGWGCSQCSGPLNVLPGTVVNLINAGESGPLQMILGPGTYTITNAATTGNYSAWNFAGYPTSGNWVWSFMIGSDNGNGTATVLNDDYIGGIFPTQAAAAGANTATWDGQNQLPGNSTGSFIDTLTLPSTTTLDFFVDDYGLNDNGGGVALNITPTDSGAPEPAPLVLIGAGLVGLSLLRKRASTQSLKALAIVSLLMVPAAFAQNQRSWVSSTGSDSNPCTRSSPCATFQAALAKTNSGGEIDVVDPGDYGNVFISQSVTIDGGGMGRISPNGFGGIIIYSGNVSLLNLSVVGPTNANYGIATSPGAGSVNIRNVHVYGFGDGINAQGSETTVADSFLEGSSFNAVYCKSTCILRSTILTGSVYNGVAVDGTATVDSCLVADNGGVGIAAGVFAQGTVQLTNTTIVGNTVGLANHTGSSIISFVNNRIYGNGTNGSPTSSVFQK